MNRNNNSILVVDDSRVDSEIVKSLLIRSGYQVKTAATCKEAIEIVEDRAPSLVLLDVILPDGNGYETCRVIKDFSRNNDIYIPVILLTGLHGIEDKIEGLESGADDFVSKPPIPLELLARVRSLLRVRELQQNLHEANLRITKANSLIEREIARIGDIQRSFLPQQLPSHAHVKLAACYHPSAEAGGDYYDVIPLDENRWAIVMADIAGHGASAAVVMAITQMAVKDIALNCETPQQALLRINEKLSGHLQSHHFVTMFYSILSLNERELIYASAGHNPMLFYVHADNSVHLLETEPSYPLCTFLTDGYMEYRRRFEPGDRLMLYTDGVLDVQREDKDFYGLERLTSAFLTHRLLQPHALIDSIFQDTEAFRDEADRVDDFTLMAVGFE